MLPSVAFSTEVERMDMIRTVTPGNLTLLTNLKTQFFFLVGLLVGVAVL